MKYWFYLIFIVVPGILIAQVPDTIPWQDLDLSKKLNPPAVWNDLELTEKSEVQNIWDDLNLAGPTYKDPDRFPWWALTPVVVVPPILLITLNDDEPVEPPTLQCQAPITLNWGEDLPAPDINSVSVESTCPDGFTVIHLDDQSNGASGCFGDPLIYSRIYQVKDECGNTVTCEQTFTYLVDDEAPVVSCPIDVEVECDQTDDLSLTGQPLATDNCTIADQIILSFEDDQSGLTDCGGTGTLIRTWTATDLCENTSTCSQQITVVDLTAPLITCPVNITVNCGEQDVLSITGQATATDNCSPNMTISYTDDLSGFSECAGVIIRTWSAVDECGNESSCEQEITVLEANCDFDPVFAITDSECGLATGSILTIISPIGSYDLLWSDGQSGTNPVDLAGGLYSVSITDLNENCTEIFDIQVFEQGPDYIDVLLVNPASCNVCGDIIIDLEGTGPFDVTLNGPVVINIPDLAPGVLNVSDYICLDPGSYTIEVFDIGIGITCTDLVEVDVPFVPGIELAIVSATPPSLPGNMDGFISLFIVTPNVQYPVIILVNGVFYGETFAPNFVVENLGEGTFTIWVIESMSGCESNQVVAELISIPLAINLPLHQIAPLNPYQDFPDWQELHQESFDLEESKDLIQDWIVEHPGPIILSPFDYQVGVPVNCAFGFYIGDEIQVNMALVDADARASAKINIAGVEEGVLESRLHFTQLDARLQRSFLFSDNKIRPYFGAGLILNQFSRANARVSINNQSMSLPDEKVIHFWDAYLVSGLQICPTKDWQIHMEISSRNYYGAIKFQHRF